MKLICLCSIFVSFVFISLINLNYYRQRLKLVNDLLMFFKIYINEISFNKSDYQTIVGNNIEKFGVHSRALLLNSRDVSKYPNIITNQEKNDINFIFDGLGKHELDSEIGVCKNAEIKLCEMQKKAIFEYKAKGELRTKLIFVFGIVLLIIII